MPLALDDPRWNDLHSAYNGTQDIVDWLAEAYRADELTDERLGDLINEVQHQGDTSTAMYALAPHLLSFAINAKPETALHLLSHVGLIYAEAGAPDAAPCPEFLRGEFESTAPVAARLLAPLLLLATDFDSFKWGIASLAGLVGHQTFGRLLEDFEYYEGKFYHQSLEEPFPLDE